jgi:transposase
MERGRPVRIGPAVREQICRVAKSPPQQLGLSFTTWSQTKLAEYLAMQHNIKVSAETVRQVLRDAGVRWQATKTWKLFQGSRFRRQEGSDPRPV